MTKSSSVGTTQWVAPPGAGRLSWGTPTSSKMYGSSSWTPFTKTRPSRSSTSSPATPMTRLMNGTMEP